MYSKENLKQIVDLTNEILFDEEDINKIHHTFKDAFTDEKSLQIFERLDKTLVINKNDNLNKIIELVAGELTKQEIKHLIYHIQKNEALVWFINDFFLEKLI